MKNLTLKELTSKDVSDIYMLQSEFAGELWFTHRDIYSIFYACQKERVIGLYSKDELVAYSIFSIACNFDKAYIPKEYYDKVVGKFSGTVVSTLYHGQGIQKYFLNNHINYAERNNIKYIMSYAHIDNKHSKRNIEKSGLVSVGVKFVIHKNQEREIFLLDRSL